MYAQVFYADELFEAYVGRPTTYTKVWEGEVELPEGFLDRGPTTFCEVLFERFNIGDHGGRTDIRSMSVGDEVVVGDVRYVCKSLGFQPRCEVES